MVKDIVHYIYNYFKQYSEEAPLPTLISEVLKDATQTGANKDEIDLVVETVTILRNDFGYSHPIEDKADKADMAPFLAKLKERRLL